MPLDTPAAILGAVRSVPPGVMGHFHFAGELLVELLTILPHHDRVHMGRRKIVCELELDHVRSRH